MRKGLFGKIIVSVIVAVNSVFAVVVLYIFYHTGKEPTGLITA